MVGGTSRAIKIYNSVKSFFDFDARVGRNRKRVITTSYVHIFVHILILTERV